MIAPTTCPVAPTLAEIVERLGSIPLERIPSVPAPGMATETDVFRRPGGEKRLYELVDGVLVEKPMGYYESLLAGVLIQLLRNFLDEHGGGIVLAPDATLRFEPGLVRLPDVGFISWDHFPGRILPREPILDLAPDLAVEILSKSNTRAEMERKLREYFAVGTRRVWYVEPDRREVTVYTGPEESLALGEGDVLTGGEVLPGFSLAIADWFQRAGKRHAEE